jgi:tRNA ligase
VDAFAEEWGFIATKSIVMKTIPEVKAFTEETGKTGTWNGEAIEGFVVRTHVVEPPQGESNRSASPYSPGSTFFFKVKFDEPYMMYRDWREITKKLLNAKGTLNEVNLPPNKMKRLETKAYVKWVKEEIKRDRSAFSEYTKGKGIISTREKFLQWMASEEGKKGLKMSEAAQRRSWDQNLRRKSLEKPLLCLWLFQDVVGLILPRVYVIVYTEDYLRRENICFRCDSSLVRFWTHAER